MDRNTVTGLILIFLITLAWFYYTAPTQEELERQEREKAVADSVATQIDTSSVRPELRPIDNVETKHEAKGSSLGFFATDSTNSTTISTKQISTSLYTITFSNHGAGPSRLELKEFTTWDGKPVQLIADSTRSVYSLGFTSAQNYNIDTQDLLFSPQFDSASVNLADGDSLKLTYNLDLQDRGGLIFEYTLYGGSYEIGLQVRFDQSKNLISSRTMELGWMSGLLLSERYLSTEAPSVSAYSYAGEELEKFILDEAGRQEKAVNGNVAWVATKTKFFTQIIKPKQSSDGAFFIGERIGEDSDPAAVRRYTSSIRTALPESGVLGYRMFVGPLSYSDLKQYDEHAFDMVEMGYAFLRFFSDPLVRYAIIPYFNVLSDYISNYGILIILFAFVIKLVLYPLTKKSFESMAAMRELQPELKLLQEKYKNDPQKQQQALLKLYKDAKVNPLGGCLPNLLQLPILITLWMFFQNSILIRQKPFLWAEDLSAPDVILSLPFHIPLLGDHISGFVLLMTATMVWQMMISGQAASNPQMKVLNYILPAMMFLFFNNIASGLSLYYMIYNVLSIGQQLLVNKQIDHAKLMGTIDKKTAKSVMKGKKS